MFDELFPILSTSDMAAALGFYRDLLGATVAYQFPPTGDPSYVGLRLGASHVGVTLEPSSGRSATLWVYAQDCDAAVALLRNAGVTVVAEPADQPWGERMATVLDPDGNRVHVAARAS